MPTPAERQALLFFAAIAALGVGVNAWRAARGGEPVIAGSKTELAAQIARVDSVVAASPSRDAKRKKKAKEKAPPATYPQSPNQPLSAVSRLPSAVQVVDLDAADSTEILALPKIGPALAHRIVANRDSFGPFGSLNGLQRVRGVGPGMAKALRELVVFSGVARPDAPTGSGKGRGRRQPP
jgi:competence protein ComEA